MQTPEPKPPHEPADRGSLTAILARALALRSSPIALSMFLGLTAVAVIAQPFDTHGALSLPLRGLYWSVLIAVSIVAGATCDEISYRLSHPRVPWQAALIAALLMTATFAPFVYLWSQVLILLGGGLDPQFWSMVLHVFVPSLTVYSVIHALRPYLHPAGAEASPEVEAAPGTEPDPLPRLFSRLNHPQAIVYRVSANDHLTLVATDRGVEQIRMRFADAVEEMAPVAGCHVHRSHWVPLEAVDAVERRSGKLMVKLINGDELPVSRTYRPRLEEARPELF